MTAEKKQAAGGAGANSPTSQATHPLQGWCDEVIDLAQVDLWQILPAYNSLVKVVDQFIFKGALSGVQNLWLDEKKLMN